MASDNSFDIVSEFDKQELTNVLDQVRREILNRYDFKGSKTEIEQEEDKLVLTTEHDMRLQAIKTSLLTKAAKRGLSTKIFDFQEAKEAGGALLRQEVVLRQGLDQDTAKKIVKKVKDAFKKVKVSIQGETVRVADKKRDTLQEVITFLKGIENIEYPLQFKNFR